MMKRPAIWLKRIVLGLAMLVIVGLLAYAFVLPSMLHRKVAGALDGLGLIAARLHVDHVSLSRTVISDIILDARGRLRAGTVIASYTPADLRAGRIDRIEIVGAQLHFTYRDGKFDLGELANLRLPASQSGPATMPFTRIDLRSCSVLIDVAGMPYRADIDGSITASPNGDIAADLRLLLQGLPVTLVGTMAAKSGDLNVDVALDPRFIPGDLLTLSGASRKTSGTDALTWHLSLNTRRSDTASAALSVRSGDQQTIVWDLTTSVNRKPFGKGEFTVHSTPGGGSAWKATYESEASEFGVVKFAAESNAAGRPVWRLDGDFHHPQWGSAVAMTQRTAAGDTVWDLRADIDRADWGKGTITAKSAAVAAHNGEAGLLSVKLAGMGNWAIPGGIVLVSPRAELVASLYRRGSTWEVLVEPESTIGFSSAAGGGWRADATTLTLGRPDRPVAMNINVAERMVDAWFAVATRGPLAVVANAASLSLSKLDIRGGFSVGLGSAMSARADVDLQANDIDMPASRITASSLTASIPVLLNEGEAVPGRFQLDGIVARGRKIPAVTGNVAVIDGVATASLTAELLRGVPLTGDIRLSLGDGVGEIVASIEPFILSDMGELRRYAPELNDMDITGRFGASLRLRLDGGGIRPLLAVDLHDVTLRSTMYDFEVTGVTASMQFDSLRPLRTPGRQRITAATLRSGALKLTDGVVAMRVDGVSDIFIERTRWQFGEEGAFVVHAVQVDPAKLDVDFEVFFENLSLRQWVQLLTKDRVVAEGRLYGRLPVRYRHHANQRLRFGQGFLYAQPGGGNLRFYDVELVNTILDQGGSPLATDPKLRMVKNNLVEAMKNFDYSQLKFDFIPQPDGSLLCRIHTAGEGRMGAKQPIGGLTVNLSRFDFYMNSAIMVKLGTSQALDSALDRFFRDTTAPGP